MKKVIDWDKGAGCTKMQTDFCVLGWQTTLLYSVNGIKNNNFCSDFWKKKTAIFWGLKSLITVIRN